MKSQLEIVRPQEREPEPHPILEKKIVLPERTRRRFDPQEHARIETVKLVQRLFVSGADAPRVVVFSGVEQRAGCSSVCARVGEVIADHFDGLVCLVDANTRSAALHHRLEIQNDAKISDQEWTFAPVRRGAPSRNGGDLWLLSYKPTGGGWQTPATLERFQKRIDELRKDFSYVLIDAPALNDYADAMLLGKIADGVVMVLEANYTRREAAKKAKDLLDASGVRVLGAVLNKRTFPVPDPIYRRL